MILCGTKAGLTPQIRLRSRDCQEVFTEYLNLQDARPSLSLSLTLHTMSYNNSYNHFPAGTAPSSRRSLNPHPHSNSFQNQNPYAQTPYNPPPPSPYQHGPNNPQSFAPPMQESVSDAPSSKLQLYQGMTFCPGLPKFPVARYLPPRGQILNFMEKQFQGHGPCHLDNCPRCGQPKSTHPGIWSDCQNPCFCHGKMMHTFMCPDLYSTTNKIGRIFKWPGKYELPSYVQIQPNTDEVEILRKNGYIKSTGSFQDILPQFTAKALSLERELNIIHQGPLGRPGYDYSVMRSDHRYAPTPTYDAKSNHGEVFRHATRQSNIPPSQRPQKIQHSLGIAQTQIMPRPNQQPPHSNLPSYAPSWYGDLPAQVHSDLTRIPETHSSSVTGHISRRYRDNHSQTIEISNIRAQLSQCQEDLRRHQQYIALMGLNPLPPMRSLAPQITREPDAKDRFANMRRDESPSSTSRTD
ncbi:unnamed protein product [Periconia digitata]|uniref:Uncharacterized protein n=1 Tax=Periconia digitata TaxID=1303443 RepID=A0A9W4XFY3_9PLEO|nr:unnamed protein product [Periconia digitata]